MPVIMDLDSGVREKNTCLGMRCYQKILNILYKDHVTVGEVHRKIQAAIGECDELLALVWRQKLRSFGHISGSSGVAKTVLQAL